LVLISVVIPVYNGEKYLRECIASAVNQRPFDKFEVIVVDDGSTDKTAEICMEFARSINYVYKENGGTASALNAGITLSKGQFIHWLSADDVLLDNALSQMLQWVSDNDFKKRKDTIYYTHYHVINQYGEFLRDFKEPVRPVKDLWAFFFGNGSTSLIHREIFEKVGNFDTGLAHSEDYEFWLRCTMLHDIKMTLIPLYTINYRNHPDQMTNKVGGKLDKEIKQAMRKRMG